MKIHEFEIYGGQTQDEEGNQEWPDYIRLKVPRSVHVQLIQFLTKALGDKEMEHSTVNFIGELQGKGEKTTAEMFGPTMHINTDEPEEPEEPGNTDS